MKISVVVTVYNSEKYIGQCIESIINQSFRNLEIILVDDGSTDSSGQICDTYAAVDNRIRVIHQSNQGQMKAWYVGASNCSGEYIANVDGDDWIDENTYSSLEPIIEEYTPDIISFGCYRYFSSNSLKESHDNVEEGYYPKKRIDEELLSRLVWDYGRNTWGCIDPSRCMKLISSKLLKEFLVSGFRSEEIFTLSYGQDTATTYPLIYRANSIYITHHNSYYHRQRTGGETAYYIRDEEFTTKLFVLYELLKNVLKEIPNITQQLDMMVCKSMKIKESFYYANSSWKKKLYLFPFNKVPQGVRVILYGAGNVGKAYFEQIKKINYCEIIAWVDQNEQIGDERVSSIQEIYDRKFDYIVIAIESAEVCISVSNMLKSKGIEEKRIIWSE